MVVDFEVVEGEILSLRGVSELNLTALVISHKNLIKYYGKNSHKSGLLVMPTQSNY